MHLYSDMSRTQQTNTVSMTHEKTDAHAYDGVGRKGVGMWGEGRMLVGSVGCHHGDQIGLGGLRWGGMGSDEIGLDGGHVVGWAG